MNKFRIKHSGTLPIIIWLRGRDVMNSFHLFVVAVEQKNKNQAMLILRDKTESVAKKNTD